MTCPPTAPPITREQWSSVKRLFQLAAEHQQDDEEKAS